MRWILTDDFNYWSNNNNNSFLVSQIYRFDRNLNKRIRAMFRGNKQKYQLKSQWIIKRRTVWFLRNKLEWFKTRMIGKIRQISSKYSNFDIYYWVIVKFEFWAHYFESTKYYFLTSRFVQWKYGKNTAESTQRIN